MGPLSFLLSSVFYTLPAGFSLLERLSLKMLAFVPLGLQNNTTTSFPAHVTRRFHGLSFLVRRRQAGRVSVAASSLTPATGNPRCCSPACYSPALPPSCHCREYTGDCQSQSHRVSVRSGSFTDTEQNSKSHRARRDDATSWPRILGLPLSSCLSLVQFPKLFFSLCSSAQKMGVKHVGHVPHSH